MATGKSYYARPSYRFLGADPSSYYSAAADSGFEFDESDLYSSAGVVSPRKISTRSVKKPSSCAVAASAAAKSLPVNVPDWSKILREEHRDNHRRRIEDEDSDDDWLDGSGGRLPPHEFLAKRRMASLSVHEGVGRTLKGRDLSRVRNAIFEKIGFQD